MPLFPVFMAHPTGSERYKGEELTGSYCLRQRLYLTQS